MKEANCLQEQSIKHSDALEHKIMKASNINTSEQIQLALSANNSKLETKISQQLTKLKQDVSEQTMVFRKELFEVEGMFGPCEQFKSLIQYIKNMNNLSAHEKKASMDRQTEIIANFAKMDSCVS